MDRKRVYEVINRERDYQDKTRPRDARLLARQYRHCAPHIILAEEYIAKARALWAKSHDELDVLQALAKAAAITVRALEEIAPLGGKRMDRHEVYLAIDVERGYQDTFHPHIDEDSKKQYSFSAPHVLLAEKYIQKAGNKWVEGDREGTISALTKVAAILVRALEEIEGPDLLVTGLR